MKELVEALVERDKATKKKESIKETWKEIVNEDCSES